MAMAVIWVPPRVDARSIYLICSRWRWQPTAGYYGVLIPTGKSCEDSWLVASALAPLTRRLRYLVAVRPGLQPPTLAARMAATLDRLSEGRLLINVVTGGDPVENKGDGIFLSHSERYQVTREFLDVYTRLLRGEKVDYHGEHIHVEGAEVLFPPVQENGPPLYFGGSSDAAIDVAAEQIDSYLTWGEPRNWWRRSWRWCASAPRPADAPCSTAFVCMSLCAKRKKRHGPPPTG